MAHENMTGQIFNIQHFSTHDGPGVRTTVFLKGCPLRCFWCQNPESQARDPVLLRTDSLCTGCGACVSVCPNGANRLEDGISRVDRERCTACGVCVRPCLPRARRICGRTASVDEILQEVLRDSAFYRNSGGGVTLSGGDPVFQPAFAAALLAGCRNNWLHTALETSGFAAWEVLEPLLAETDLLLMDLKCIDPEKHRQGTGVPNETILENAVRAAKMVPVLFRTPLIPGFNDGREDILRLREFVEDRVGLSPAEHIELLKYNPMGEAKYGYMERPGLRPSFAPQSEEYIEELTALLR